MRKFWMPRQLHQSNPVCISLKVHLILLCFLVLSSIDIYLVLSMVHQYAQPLRIFYQGVECWTIGKSIVLLRMYFGIDMHIHKKYLQASHVKTLIKWYNLNLSDEDNVMFLSFENMIPGNCNHYIMEMHFEPLREILYVCTWASVFLH